MVCIPQGNACLAFAIDSYGAKDDLYQESAGLQLETLDGAIALSMTGPYTLAIIGRRTRSGLGRQGERTGSLQARSVAASGRRRS